MSEKRRRSQRQRIELEQLKKDPNSFLSWGIEDPTLGKLETYRLYQAGYAVADIGEAFGLSPSLPIYSRRRPFWLCRQRRGRVAC